MFRSENWKPMLYWRDMVSNMVMLILLIPVPAIQKSRALFQEAAYPCHVRGAEALDLKFGVDPLRVA